MKALSIFVVLFFCFQGISRSQSDSSVVDYSKRKAWLIGSTSTLFVGGIVGLHQLWYKDYPSSGFHTFNDSRQWLGMDKVGHATSAYQSAYYGIQAFKWAGFQDKEAIWVGGSIGWAFLNTVEIFDGFSEEWGFSTADVIANSGGSLLAIGQELLFQEQIVRLKFSYSPSSYRKYRPNTLGEDDFQGILKDYNGQTYWASINLNALDNRVKPKWLNLAVGYGGDGMLSGVGDYRTESGQLFQPREQYYLSLDIDLEKIPTNKAWLRTLFSALNFIKVPFPALLLEEGALQFKPIHF